MLRKVFLTILFFVLLTLICWPLYTYNRALSLLHSYPQKVLLNELNQQDINRLWQANEPKSNIESFQNISPYWLYHWLLAAVAGDYLGLKNIDPYKNMSVMASQIAINHMNETSVQKNTKSMLWWHLLHASLSIHIQRNWSAQQIVAKYNAINS
jgi:hypothetical protein